MRLHVETGATIADITYGRGAFWKNVDRSGYTVLSSDIKTGVRWDCLPYDDNSIDAIIFDPPYMEGLYRRNTKALAGSGSHSPFRHAYSDAAPCPPGERKYHDAVLAAYLSPLREVGRVLKRGGKFIVKCQDEVSANRQKLTHIELVWAYEAKGFYCKDIFVVVRDNKPSVSRLLVQQHARKSHSYFLVFERQDHKARLDYSNFSVWLREDTV